MTKFQLLFPAIIVCWFLVTLLYFRITAMTFGEIKEYSFKDWFDKQEKLKLHIKEVCNKYGASVRKVIPMAEFIYDSRHNLLLCRNAKVTPYSWRKVQIFQNSETLFDRPETSRFQVFNLSQIFKAFFLPLKIYAIMSIRRRCIYLFHRRLAPHPGW